MRRAQKMHSQIIHAQKMRSQIIRTPLIHVQIVRARKLQNVRAAKILTFVNSLAFVESVICSENVLNAEG